VEAAKVEAVLCGKVEEGLQRKVSDDVTPRVLSSDQNLTRWILVSKRTERAEYKYPDRKGGSSA
jgi:hypothetical protein